MIINSAKEFGILVRSERKKLGWSQEKLAEKVGVSPLWVSQFERGKSSAQIGIVVRTLKTLGIKLWAGEQAPTPSRTPVVDLDELLRQPPGVALIAEDEQTYSKNDE